MLITFWLLVHIIVCCAQNISNDYNEEEIPLEHSNRLRKHYVLHEHILGSVPQIFIIGSAKCGTTSLHELLLQHPDICHSGTKEKHFFDYPPSEFPGGLLALERYRHMFRHDHPGQDCKYFIDSTPAYIRGFAIDNMNITFSPEALSQKKFVLVLREPTERECSWFQHFARGCLKHVEKVIGRDNDREVWPRQQICRGSEHQYCEKVGCFNGTEYVYRQNYTAEIVVPFEKFFEYKHSGSYYDVELSRWLRFVKREQIFIISFRSLIEETAMVIKRLASFLGLTQGFGGKISLPHENANTRKNFAPCDCATLDKWRKDFEVHNTMENTLRLINSPHKSEFEPVFPNSTFDYRRKCE
jgi:hypothetical protein